MFSAADAVQLKASRCQKKPPAVENALTSHQSVSARVPAGKCGGGGGWGVIIMMLTRVFFPASE